MRSPVFATALFAACLGACDRPTSSGQRPRPSLESAGATSSARADGSHARAPLDCSIDTTFPSLWALPEASAAVEIELGAGVRAIIAFADSGHHGDAMVWTLPAGPLRPGHLALDKGASDDIEGAAWTGGHLYTLTSSGAIRRYTPSAAGDLARDRDAYALGPSPYTCKDLRNGNCGNNYEGLCLRAASTSRCAGYAASKTRNALFCLVFAGDALAIDATRPPIQLDLAPRALSDCAFGAEGGPAEDTFLVTTNIYGGSTSYLVDEVTGALSRIDIVGLPNNEGIAVDHSGAIYQFMDGDTDVSAAYRTVCRGWPTNDRPIPHTDR